MNKSQKGFSLIEILISLGIVASLLLLVFIVVPRVQAQLRVNETSEQITGMVASLKGLYTTAKDFKNLTTSGAVKGHIYYDNMPVTKTSGSESIKNAWDGDVFFNPDPGVGSAGDTTSGARYTSDIPSRRFMITYTNVPDNECAKLASSVGTNFAVVVVNGKDGAANNSSADKAVLYRLNGSTDMEIKPDLALNYCNGEATTVNVLKAGRDTASAAASYPGNVIQFIGQIGRAHV